MRFALHLIRGISHTGGTIKVLLLVLFGKFPKGIALMFTSA